MKGRTYNPPIAKIEIRPIFCRLPRFKLLITGMGKRMMAKSVAMLIAALVNHIANWFKHVAFSLVQNALTGTQAKILAKTVQKV